jgi:Zn-dependent M16 (insulinase) family peptidase
MPRFYFDLTSKDVQITDEVGKDLDTLNEAYDYAQKLIEKILFHVGYNDADKWKVFISNKEHDAQMIVPFAGSDVIRAQRPRIS